MECVHLQKMVHDILHLPSSHPSPPMSANHLLTHMCLHDHESLHSPHPQPHRKLQDDRVLMGEGRGGPVLSVQAMLAQHMQDGHQGDPDPESGLHADHAKQDRKGCAELGY